MAVAYDIVNRLTGTFLKIISIDKPCPNFILVQLNNFVQHHTCYVACTRNNLFHCAHLIGCQIITHKLGSIEIKSTSEKIQIIFALFCIFMLSCEQQNSTLPDPFLTTRDRQQQPLKCGNAARAETAFPGV